jgi:hypothetical protein
VKSSNHETTMRLKRRYLRKAIAEYEYSFAPEYTKRRMTRKALTKGTVDFDWQDAEVQVSPDGAWVAARVWVPKEWLQARRRRGAKASYR